MAIVHHQPHACQYPNSVSTRHRPKRATNARPTPPAQVGRSKLNRPPQTPAPTATDTRHQRRRDRDNRPARHPPRTTRGAQSAGARHLATERIDRRDRGRRPGKVVRGQRRHASTAARGSLAASESPANTGNLALSKTEGGGFEPPRPVTRPNGFQDRRIQPLCHPSGGYVLEEVPPDATTIGPGSRSCGGRPRPRRSRGFTLTPASRRGGRVAEGTRLLSEYGG